jgi:hypothetical protein
MDRSEECSRSPLACFYQGKATPLGIALEAKPPHSPSRSRLQPPMAPRSTAASRGPGCGPGPGSRWLRGCRAWHGHAPAVRLSRSSVSPSTTLARAFRRATQGCRLLIIYRWPVLAWLKSVIRSFSGCRTESDSSRRTRDGPSVAWTSLAVTPRARHGRKLCRTSGKPLASGWRWKRRSLV